MKFDVKKLQEMNELDFEQVALPGHSKSKPSLPCLSPFWLELVPITGWFQFQAACYWIAAQEKRRWISSKLIGPNTTLR